MEWRREDEEFPVICKTRLSAGNIFAIVFATDIVFFILFFFYKRRIVNGASQLPGSFVFGIT